MRGAAPGHAFPRAGVFAAALDGVIVMDADGIVIDWNPAAETMFGLARDEAVGKELAALIIPPRCRDLHRRAFARYVATRERRMLDRRREFAALRRGGHEFPVELTVTTMPNTEPPLFVGFARDLSERERARRDAQRMQQRLRFIAHAGLALDVSLDLDDTLQRLADLPVPELAEIAVIDLLATGGSIGGVAVAAADSAAREAVARIRAECPLDAGGAHPVSKVLRTGGALLLPEMAPGDLERYAGSPEHYELMRRLRYRSAIVVPLAARKRLLGTLSLVRTTDRPPFDEHDLLLAETLGRRAGLALENARLYQSTRRIARTLQQSLLERELPRIPGVRLAARYLAAAEGQEVGGDFYDAFEIRNRRYGIAIGDVCGKGPEAAALTALARYTIRAVADRGPTGVMRLLNDAVRRDHQFANRFLSAVFGDLRTRDGDVVLELAVAGHPPPFVVRADGSVEVVEARGPLIGVARRAQFTSERVALAPGDRLVLYTDGLTDARAPETVFGEDDIAALLTAGRDHDPEGLARFLEAEVTAGRDPRDDIAILVVEALATTVRQLDAGAPTAGAAV
jgi:PAS domain S-box-containing protein